jgi:hypothetical protein
MNVPGQISPNAMGMDPNIQQAVASPQVFHPAPPDAPKPNAGMYSDMDEQHTTPDEGQPPIRKLLESANIAENLDEDKLREIGSRCKRGFEQDTQSREEWEKNVDSWTKMATQAVEAKTYPWPKASNIKYPLLSTAAMQFAARAYPSLIPSDGQVVKSMVIGKDPDGSKQQSC